MGGIFHLRISFNCLFRVIFYAFIADKVDDIVDNGSGGTTSLDVQTLLEACFIDIDFLVRSRTSGLGTALLKHWVIRISEILAVRLKEFCHIYIFTLCNIFSFSLL